ncbi:MAG: YggS family pyridoxal phosphate-dependent enzyme [Phycisphaerae bacterium]|nr:YggS family pyridoxal phosphate-dependent enzyme [Phycisphaerae bacterium]
MPSAASSSNAGLMCPWCPEPMSRLIPSLGSRRTLRTPPSGTKRWAMASGRPSPSQRGPMTPRVRTGGVRAGTVGTDWRLPRPGPAHMPRRCGTISSSFQAIRMTGGHMSTLEQRYIEVKQRVAEAAQRSGRTPNSVYLIAVTKFAEPEDIRELIELGHRDFGENKVQQLSQRAGVINEWFERMRMHPRVAGEHSGFDPSTPVRWHMIGHLQRNKVRKIADIVRLVHSVDSLRLAEEIQQVANKLDRQIDVLLQVNVSGEDSKFGVPIAAAGAIAEQIDTMINVRVRGLMTMAPLSSEPEAVRPHFTRCRELYEDMKRQGVGEGHFDLLSMGMSGDYEVAIEEGANLVRVGSAIFGTQQDEEAAEPSLSGSGD